MSVLVLDAPASAAPVAIDRPERATASVDARMPQLDALRAFAVFAVMVHHFWRQMSFGLPLGTVGVQLFFVLSGFLITGILLRARGVVNSGAQSAAIAIRRFYLRRFLRIFPLFYMTLAVAWLAGLPEVRDSILWHVMYATNLYFARIGEWHGAISHLWSLAVEEQFYLVWPFIVILTPRRRLLPVLWSIAASAPAFRLIGSLAGMSEMALWTLPFASLDSLALGGILGYASTPGYGGAMLRSGLVRAGFWVGTPLAAGLWLIGYHEISTPRLELLRMVFENTAWAVFFLWLIGGAARGYAGIAGWILTARPLLYLGQISYGLYVFHPFMRRLVPWTFHLFGLHVPRARPASFACLVLATIIVAACSWHLYERPLNALKQRFSV